MVSDIDELFLRRQMLLSLKTGLAQISSIAVPTNVSEQRAKTILVTLFNR